MHKLGYFIAAAAALAITVPAHAAGAKYNAANSPRVSPEVGGAQGFATSVQLAYSYTRGFGVDRSVGVLAFTNPSTGIYCIQPTTALKLTKIYPLVSIEWGLSFGESLQAFWEDTSNARDCHAGNLEVRTYDISTGTSPVLTGNVAFDIVVN